MQQLDESSSHQEGGGPGVPVAVDPPAAPAEEDAPAAPQEDAPAEDAAPAPHAPPAPNLPFPDSVPEEGYPFCIPKALTLGSPPPLPLTPDHPD